MGLQKPSTTPYNNQRISLAILTSLLLDQYGKALVWDFPVKTSLSINK